MERGRDIRWGWLAVTLAALALCVQLIINVAAVDPVARSVISFAAVAVSSAIACVIGVIVRHGITGRDRRTWFFLIVTTLSALCAWLYEGFVAAAQGELTRSPTPEDVFFLVAIGALFLVAVEIANPARSRKMRLAGNALDFLAIMGGVFVVGYILVLRPLGIVIPTVSVSRGVLMAIYFTAPVALAVFPVVFREDPWPRWMGLVALGIAFHAAYGVHALIVVGRREYFIGSPGVHLAQAWVIAGNIAFVLAGMLRLRLAHNAEPRPSAELPSWPGIVMLVLAIPGVPLAVYYMVDRADQFSRVVIGLSLSAIVAILMVRSVMIAFSGVEIETVKHEVGQYRALVESSPIPVIVVDVGGRIVYANLAAANTLGASSAYDLIGMRHEELLVPGPEGIEARSDITAMLSRFVRSGDVAVVPPRHQRLRRLDGRLIDIERSAAPIRYAGAPAALIQGAVITERLEAEARSAEYRDQLKALAAQLVATEERERHRLAQALHDQVSQQLVVAIMRLQAYGHDAGDPEGDFAIALQMLDEALAETRELTTELAPQMLYELGTAEALRWLCASMTKSFGLSCEVEGELDDDGLDDAVRALLFRSVRELAINAVKHAQARSLVMSLAGTTAEVRITVGDDGRGFDVGATRRAGSFGLMSIEESLAAQGGRLEIESAPGSGTRATVVLPRSVGSVL